MFDKKINNKIIKVYYDLEPSYNGNETGNNIFNNLNDWDATVGMLGILKVEFDTKRKTKKELFFKQVLNPTVDDYIKLLLSNDIDLIVSWNGRGFDNILINNLLSEKNQKVYIKKLANNDRDILDICRNRNIKTKGGLSQMPEYLDINIDTSGKDVKLDKFFNDWDIVFRSKEINTKEYVKSLSVVKERNKFDCEILMLIEEKLDLLYTNRIEEDDFHKIWETRKVRSQDEKNKGKKIGESMKKIKKDKFNS